MPSLIYPLLNSTSLQVSLFRMKHIFPTILALICCNYSDAQDRSWEYGINANFNVALIKPSVSDTFTNKAGFGGGLFVEMSKGKYALQLAPSFSKTSFIHDDNLTTTHMNSLDVSADLIFTPEVESSVYFTLGATPCFNFSYVAKSLDGTKATGASSQHLTGLNEFEVAAKFGASLELNDGIRFHSNYYEFFNGSLKKGKIKGRADYIQFGIQIRFNEYLNGEKSEANRLREAQEIKVAQEHINALNAGATMLFVLPPKSPGKRTDVQIKQVIEIT